MGGTAAPFRRLPMTDDLDPPSRRVLDPIDRISEVLFGLFMVLTFTGTLSVVDSGRDEVRDMMIAAIGCNMAWGFVDGVMYVMRNLVERDHSLVLLRDVRGSAKPERAYRLIARSLGPLAGAIGAAELERIRRWIVGLPPQAHPSAAVTRRDVKGAIAVFLLVFLSTFPVVVPFVFIDDPALAKRVSAGVAIAMLFACGVAWGRHAGRTGWRSGLAMVALGLVVETIVIALGG